MSSWETTLRGEEVYIGSFAGSQRAQLLSVLRSQYDNEALDKNLGHSEVKVVGEVSWFILPITLLYISQTMFANAVQR